MRTSIRLASASGSFEVLDYPLQRDPSGGGSVLQVS
jgi:hypothetical protein